MAKKEEKNIKDKTSFFKGFKAELKKVIWPTPKQLFNNTVAVLVIVIITAVIVFVLDFLFRTINEQGIDRIKNIVTNSTVEETIDSTIENSVDDANVINDETIDEDEADNIEDSNLDAEEVDELEDSDSNADETVDEDTIEDSEE